MGVLSGHQFWRQQQPPQQQLPMFMSARDIKEQYQPLPGDRGEVTHLDPNRDDLRLVFRDETDEEFWDRKAEEAADIPTSTREGYTTDLYSDIQDRGVQHPVHLSAMSQRRREHFGKDMVVGGHHRIAVMDEDRPDDLMPVLHHESIITAQGDPRGYIAEVQRGRPYPYT